MADSELQETERPALIKTVFDIAILMDTSRLEPWIPLYECTDWAYITHLLGDFARHEKSAKHKERENPRNMPGDTDFRCEPCKYSTRFQRCLRGQEKSLKHIKRTRDIEYVSNGLRAGRTETPRYEYSICGLLTHSLVALKRHKAGAMHKMREANPRPSVYKCEPCNFSTPDRSVFVKHEKSPRHIKMQDPENGRDSKYKCEP